jgi:ATP-binding cassette subfamily F protein 3
MLSVQNLSYFIADRPIYENASLHIKEKEKIGLIGLNGRGKSTLLKIITGEITNYTGEISKSKDCTIGFLNQDLLSFQSDDSILDVAMTAFQDVVDLQHQIDRIIHELETEYSDERVEKLTKLQERFESLEGYTLQSRAEEILEGVGFQTSDLQRPLKEFSGGWRMRVMLAKLLLEKSSLLLLDEPTNHLDLPSIKWIEGYLRNYDGAVVIVSHDRYFINNTVQKIVEVNQANLDVYVGDYEAYLKEKEERAEIQQNAYENQQQKIKQTERFIERFRAKATKARQVQSKVKMLEKMETVEKVEEDLSGIKFRFNVGQQPGKLISTIEDVSKSYGSLDILRNTSNFINRGDKIALIGANGKGKSTMLRIVAGTESHKGEAKLGYNVNMAFYAQHQLEALNIDNDLITELQQAGSGKPELELRSTLGSFLFTGDDIYKKIKVLSGGEKSRGALAKTLISEANFLLLDEPTNHLDMLSVGILIEALKQFEGSFLVVSHDRYFISQIANKIWYIEDKQVKEYPGTYEEFEASQSEKLEELDTIKQYPAQERQNKPKNKKQQNKGNNEVSRLKKELETLEFEITRQEEKVKGLEEEMSNPVIYSDINKLSQVNEQYEKESEVLKNLNQDWEKTAECIDAGEQS